MIANYHTHSRWCNHAVGEIEDYFEKAVELGFHEIAMTDHVPRSTGFSWMPFSDLPAYDQALNEAIRKYEDKIKIYKGFECEYIPKEMDYYHRLEEMGYTFLIQGQHCAGKNCEVNAFSMEKKEEAYDYAESVCQGIETGVFQFLAHPDVILCSYPGEWDAILERTFHEIFQCCEEYHMPVEINASGLRGKRGYPAKEVYTLAKQYDLHYLINADAHDPNWLCDEILEEAEDFARELNILVDPLFRKY